MSSLLYSNTYKLSFMQEGLSGRIALLLKKTGASQADLARVAKVTPTTPMYWLNGSTKELKPQNAFPIADHFKCSARWLMTGEGPPWPNGIQAVAEEEGKYATARPSRVIERLQALIDRGELTDRDVEILELLATQFRRGDKS